MLRRRVDKQDDGLDVPVGRLEWSGAPRTSASLEYIGKTLRWQLFDSLSTRGISRCALGALRFEMPNSGQPSVMIRAGHITSTPELLPPPVDPRDNNTNAEGEPSYTRGQILINLACHRPENQADSPSASGRLPPNLRCRAPPYCKGPCLRGGIERSHRSETKQAIVFRIQAPVLQCKGWVQALRAFCDAVKVQASHYTGSSPHWEVPYVARKAEREVERKGKGAEVFNGPSFPKSRLQQMLVK